MSTRRGIIRAVVAAAVTGAFALAAPGMAVAATSYFNLLTRGVPTNVPGWKISVQASTAPEAEYAGGALRSKRGSVDELHMASADHPRGRWFTFDGKRGAIRLGRQGGSSLKLSMAIRRVGRLARASAPIGCTGGHFATANVVLTGQVVVATGVAPLGTQRATKLRGKLTFNRGGRVQCGHGPLPCIYSTTMFGLGVGASDVFFLANEQPRLNLFDVDWATPQSGSRSGWLHSVTQHLDASPFAGTFPNLALNPMPPGSPIVVVPGTQFTPTAPVDSFTDNCGTNQNDDGVLNAPITATFTGWGPKTYPAGGNVSISQTTK